MSLPSLSLTGLTKIVAQKVRAVLVAIADIRAILLARERRLDLVQGMAVGRVGEQEVEALRKQLVAVVTGQLQERVVGEDDRMVGLLGVGEHHRHSRRIRRDHERAEVVR